MRLYELISNKMAKQMQPEEEQIKIIAVISISISIIIEPLRRYPFLFGFASWPSYNNNNSQTSGCSKASH